MNNQVVPVTSRDLKEIEVSWFAPLYSDDYQFLGVSDGNYRSSRKNVLNIFTTAEKLGFKNILCPSSYIARLDPLSFASGVAPLTNKINLLVAIRCGELHPLMLARSIATLDHMLEGHLTINIISSNMPGEDASGEVRYEMSSEVVQVIKQCWTQDVVNFSEKHYNFTGFTTDSARPYQQNGGPLRIHMIVRDTEKEAYEYADYLIPKLDQEKGQQIKHRALDAKTMGMSIQAKNIEQADEFGFIEKNVWSGIGRTRSGCGSALVGSVDQVLSKIEEYQKMGIRAFIFSGYPHLQECEIFNKKILPQLKTCSLPHVYGRVPTTIPKTPLGFGVRR